MEREKHVEALWQSYAEYVVPKDTGAVQMRETRRAFYAGAFGILMRMTSLISGESEPTPADLRLLDDIEYERAGDEE